MTKNTIEKLTPELVLAMLDEACLGGGAPTQEGWTEIMETSGIGLVASNAVRRAFERNEWTSAWSLIEHIVRYFAPLADPEAGERALAVMVEVRAGRWDELEDLFQWARTRSAAARCLVLAVDLGGMPNIDGCRELSADLLYVISTIAKVLANEVSESAAREFVAGIEALQP